MSFPTLTECYAQTRAECGDTAVAGGQIYTDPMLLPHIQNATRALWRGMRNLAVPRVRRELYYTLPANTSIFYPAIALVTDFSEPSGPVAARGGVTMIANIAATPIARGVDITCSGPHGLTTGNTVVLEQIPTLKNINVQCAITVTSSFQLIADGVLTSGPSSTPGGYVTYSSNEFGDLQWATGIPSGVNNTSTQLGAVRWQNGYFQFVPCSEAKQLRIFYWSSAQVPTTGTDQIGVNDCIDFISQFAAGKAQKAQGANDRAATAMDQAVGPGYTRGTLGGELLQLLQTAVRERQNLPPYQRSPRPFREQAYSYTSYPEVS